MNIMIRLDEICKTGNVIYANVITVEAHPETFKIGVDTVEKKLVVNTHNKIDSCVAMAMAKLIKLDQECGNKLPKKEECVWY